MLWNKINPSTLLLHLLSDNRLSLIGGKFAEMRILSPFHKILIYLSIKLLKINKDEFEKNFYEYKTFSDFFIRRLKNGARKICEEDKAIVSPCDGYLQSYGEIDGGTLLLIKGIEYKIENLLLDPVEEKRFRNGLFIAIYLSPRDYHRVHFPLDCEVTGYKYIPGRLYSVNNFAIKKIKEIYTKNERLITYLKTKYGIVACVMVGACCVGKISVNYLLDIKKNSEYPVKKTILKNPLPFKKGDEMGAFKIGSTIILLFENKNFQFHNLFEGKHLKMGEKIMEAINVYK